MRNSDERSCRAMGVLPSKMEVAGLSATALPKRHEVFNILIAPAVNAKRATACPQRARFDANDGAG